jgi:hypothetical protein
MYNGAALAASDRFTHPAADVISSDHHPNSHTYLYTQPDIDPCRVGHLGDRCDAD